jgi:glycosyltransferase involved in cell wall biosynthesis
VIDDGSTDDSPQVIRKVLSECKFPNELFVRENRGLSATLNEGFAMTDSEYFAYLGSDDVWLPTMVEKQIALLEKRPKAVLAYCHAYVIDEHDQIFDRTDRWSRLADGDLLPALLNGEIFSSPGVVYRRSAVEKYGWNEDAALEDYELYLKLTAEGEFARNEKLLCGWRVHGRNTSGDPAKMVDEQLAALRRFATSTGIDKTRSRDLERRRKFRAVSEFVRVGKKPVAWKWFRENIGGSPSFGETAKTLARLLIPNSLFQWNRSRKTKRAISKYGKIDLSE